MTSFILIPLFEQVSPIILVGIAIIIDVLIIFLRGIKKRSVSIEERFMGNLYTKEKLKEQNSVLLPSIAKELLAKDIHVEEITVSYTSSGVGKTLGELNFRGKTKVNIVCIIRGDRKINIPDANERIFPNDRLIVTGSDDEIQKLIKFIDDKEKEVLGGLSESNTFSHHIGIAQYTIEKGSLLIGQSIKHMDIQKRTECMIIGIDRDERSITDFKSLTTFKESDILWLAGESEKLDQFEENINGSTSLI